MTVLAHVVLTLMLVPGAGLDAGEPPAPGDTAAVLDGETITVGELDRALGGPMLALRSQEYALRRRALDEEIDRRLLDRYARSKGVTVDQLLRAETQEGAPPDPGVAAGPQMARRRAELVTMLRAKAAVAVNLVAPRIDVRAGDSPSRGRADAPIVIVAFSDFQCPFCARALPTIREVERRYGDRVRLVFRNFPLPGHRNARQAAEAAACAADQGRFWEMHDRLFAEQAHLDTEDLKKYAAALSLDGGAFEKCLTSGQHAELVRADVSDGVGYGITGTPTFFINGRPVTGARPLDDFVQVIEEELRLAAGSSRAQHRPGSAR